MTDTLTMQQVADLAHVERAVVSMWRTRYVDSDEPFPAPCSSTGSLSFRASDVAAWLTRTGRGNNPDAGVDAALHSSRFVAVLDRADAASRLLLLQTLVGEPLVELERETALDVIGEAAERRNLAALLPASPTLAALADAALVADIDALVEAGYSGERVLWRMIEALRAAAATTPLADAALTAGGASLFTAALGALATGRRVLAHGEGALALIAQAVGREGVQMLEVGLSLSEGPESQPSLSRAVLLAAFAASGVDFDADIVPEGGTLHLFVEPSATMHDAQEIFASIRRIGHELEPDDIALVIAPADLLVADVSSSPEGYEARRDCFNIAEAMRVVARHAQQGKPGAAPDYTLPLRYVATLPKGLLRATGRRRLAVWVLAPHADDTSHPFTRYGDHAAHALDVAECEALASDLVAACSPDSSRHAYLRTRQQATLNLLNAASLVITPGLREPRDGGEVLAAVWRHERAAGGLSTGTEVVSAGLVAVRAPRSWNEIVTKYARVRPGHRVPDALTHSAVGAVVIGPDEVCGDRLVGSRHIDRLQLERVAPQAQFTEPGDVVFTNVGAVAAIVDVRGGAVVQQPARILRPKHDVSGGMSLVPAQAAIDINAQRSGDTAGWHVHVTPQDQFGRVELIAQSVATRRAELRAQLDALDAYESTVLTSVAQGLLRVNERDATSVMQADTASTGGAA